MPMAFLHTAPPNVEVFAQLAARLAPGLSVPYALIDDVLREAVTTGTVTESMRDETAAAIRRLAESGASLVVCTCSTIGSVAEAVPVPAGVRVVRIDRAMAEAAVASGRRIVVAAALPSTIAPTVALLREVSAAVARQPEIVDLLCEGAWAHFERGDAAAYARAIADRVRDVATPSDIVVLAQATMAPAAPLLEALGIRALASPELGLRAALEIGRRG